MAKTKTIGKHEKVNITASANNGVADIRIVDYIGAENNDDVSMRAIVDNMLAQNIKTANVYLNSQGGSVFAATEMANQLARFDSVEITIGSLAASAATYLTSKFRTKASSNSQLMIHKPSTAFFGNSGEMESEMKLLKNLEEDYKAAYAAKTGMKPEDIDGLWAKGDYWMNAQEALDKHFIDEIIDKSIAIDENDISLLTACGAPNIPKVQNKNTNMERLQLIAALGLAADATDETITAKLNEYKIKAQALDAVKASEAKLKTDRATALVDRAILGKKITAAQKDTYVSLATENYEAVATLLDTTPVVQAVSGQLPNVPPTTGDDARAAWTLEDWQEKDPEGLSALFDKDREKFTALQTAYAKKK